MGMGLLSMQTGTLIGDQRQELDPATALVAARRQQVAARRSLESRWAMRPQAPNPAEDAPLASVAESTQRVVHASAAEEAASRNSAPLASVAESTHPLAHASVAEETASRNDVSSKEPHTAHLEAAGAARVSAVEAGCAAERRPYHTILTSSSGTYQSWQCRIMYHHYKLQKARHTLGLKPHQILRSLCSAFSLLRSAAPSLSVFNTGARPLR